MTTINEKAVEFVFSVLNDLDSNAEVFFDQQSVNLFIYRFKVTSKEEKVEFQFSRSLMDDFEVAIEKYKGTDYYHTLENGIKFDIYIALGSKGLLTDFDISSEILSEKGQWLRRYSVTATFKDKILETLNNGLKRLSGFLEQVLSDHNLDLGDVKVEKEYIDGLIRYYEKHGHLNSEGVGIESLGFLKAAAVSEIIEKDKERSQTQIARVRKEIDREIYLIIQELRQPPFLGIKLPECIYDFNDANKQIDVQRTQKMAHVKTEYQMGDKFNELLDMLNPNLKKKRIGAWMAFHSENPDKLSQSANSMVELLDQVIDQLCANKKLAEYLEDKYGTSEETQWIDATRNWISQTKSKLHRVKHHPDYNAVVLARSLLDSAETIMIALLE